MSAADSNLRGCVSVITGATSGIGRAAALALAQLGAHVVVIGRDTRRLRSTEDEIAEETGRRPEGIRADFSHLDEVRELGVRISDDYGRVDVLACNAGVMVRSRQLTEDGFESTLQTNHLSGFLLATILRERLSGGRLIITSSESYTAGRLDPSDLNGDRSRYSGGRAYSSSKQANILTAREAARRWPDVLTASYHPGEVRTRIGRDTVFADLYFKYNPWLRRPERAADTLVWLATASAQHLTSGGYYHDRKLQAPAAPGADDALAARLWQASEAVTASRRP